MGRYVITDINRLLPEPPAELRYMGHSNMIERPNHVFIKSCMVALQPDLDAIHKQIVLPNQVLFLNPVIKFLIFLFQYKHKKEPG